MYTHKSTHRERVVRQRVVYVSHGGSTKTHLYHSKKRIGSHPRVAAPLAADAFRSRNKKCCRYRPPVSRRRPPPLSRPHPEQPSGRPPPRLSPSLFLWVGGCNHLPGSLLSRFDDDEPKVGFCFGKLYSEVFNCPWSVVFGGSSIIWTWYSDQIEDFWRALCAYFKGKKDFRDSFPHPTFVGT